MLTVGVFLLTQFTNQFKTTYAVKRSVSSGATLGQTCYYIKQPCKVVHVFLEVWCVPLKCNYILNLKAHNAHLWSSITCDVNWIVSSRTTLWQIQCHKTHTCKALSIEVIQDKFDENDKGDNEFTDSNVDEENEVMTKVSNFLLISCSDWG